MAAKASIVDATATGPVKLTSGINVIAAMKGYIRKMIEISGMKALLMDAETTSMVSLVYAQSAIISQEVFLVERLDASKKVKKGEDVSMHHLKAVVFIQPNAKSVAALVAQLKKPKYKEYHVFFSNVIREEFLRQLAEADEFEVIKQVQEYFGDFYAVNDDLFHLNLPYCKSLCQPEGYWGQYERSLFKRNAEGILAVLLALKKKPLVRYQRGSDLAKRLAIEVAHKMKEEAGLFHFQRGSSDPVLLVLDRREDPLTPLLLQWTYQAMVHELLGINNNRVDMSAVPGVKPDMREVVLSCHQDRFFRGAMTLNYGDLGASIKELVVQYQRKMKTNAKIQTIEDMQRFVDQYPEFKSLSGNVSKHVTLMTELSRLVEHRDLMGVSELEQELACNNEHSECLRGVLEKMDNVRLSHDDKLRLVMLYALRYEDNRNQIEEFKSMLRDRSPTDQLKARVKAVDAVLDHAGAKRRAGDLYGNKNLKSKIASFFGAGLKDVENVYTQHKPVLAETLEKLIKDKLPPSLFPFVDGDSDGKSKTEDVIVYIVGGCTFEEAAIVNAFNTAKDSSCRIVLGGSYIHNSRSFIKDVLGYQPQPEEEKR